MPIFEYQCSDCGHRFEYLVLGSAAAPTCPECGAAELEKKVSVSAVTSAGTRKAAVKRMQERNSRVRRERAAEEHEHSHEHHH
jgi:putative FmdB family regulatory protein